jgi:cellobiose dehydrogenase (acceptor)
MDAAIQRLYASQPSTNLTSQNGVRYLQSGYDAARKWLVDGLGYKDVDINAQADDKTKVFGHPIYDYSNGQRGGPVTTYLQTALQHEKFHLESSTQVLRVEREGDLATGVIAMVNGSETFVALTPTGRVIASGGALQSPGLLMHSGIGDPATLTSLQAAGKLSRNLTSNDWINSTSIGAGLFDNPNTFIELQGPTIEAYSYSYDNPPATDKELYLDSRSGPYATAGQTSVFWTTITHDDNSIAGCKCTPSYCLHTFPFATTSSLALPLPFQYLCST